MEYVLLDTLIQRIVTFVCGQNRGSVVRSTRIDLSSGFFRIQGCEVDDGKGDQSGWFGTDERSSSEDGRQLLTNRLDAAVSISDSSAPPQDISYDDL